LALKNVIEWYPLGECIHSCAHKVHMYTRNMTTSFLWTHSSSADHRLEDKVIYQ